jgi:hypothetical protein
LGIDQNCIHDDIKSRLNSDNAYYYLVENLFPSVVCKLKDYNIKIIILPVIFYGPITWLLTLRKEHTRLRMFENRVVRRIFGQKRD